MEEVKPFLPLPAVLQGLFGLAERLFGVTLSEVPSSRGTTHTPQLDLTTLCTSHTFSRQKLSMMNYNTGFYRCFSDCADQSIMIAALTTVGYWPGFRD